MRAYSCKNILKCIPLNQKILTGTAIIRHILRKNIILISTAVDLNAFLAAFYIIFIISPECTARDRGIFYATKFQKMRFQIIEERSIFDNHIIGMSYTEAYKTTWFIFAFYTFIIKIPFSSIDHNVAVAGISTF